MKLCARCELPFDVCEDCEKADFRVEKNLLYAEDRCVLNEILVTCSNESICTNLMAMLEEADNK